VIALQYNKIVNIVISILENDEMIGEQVIIFDNKPTLLDIDVAKLYQVETREINQAVKNNPAKFPYGYVIEIDKNLLEIEDIKNFDILEKVKFSRVAPKIFTEKGLYMLATILKGERAVKTTIKIIETFAKFREATNNLNLAGSTQNQEEKGSLLKKSGLAIIDLITDNLQNDTDTTKTKITLDLGILKIEKTVEKNSK
jgi:phage regulator Rha-like protein